MIQNRRLAWALAGAVTLAAAGAWAGSGSDGDVASGASADLAPGPGGPRGCAPGFRDAGPRWPGGGRRGAWMRLLRGKLSLSADQKDRLKALRKSRKAQFEAARDALRQARRNLRKYLRGPQRGPIFTRQAWALERDVQKRRDELGELRFRTVLDIRTILTADQIQALAKDFDR